MTTKEAYIIIIKEAMDCKNAQLKARDDGDQDLEMTENIRSRALYWAAGILEQTEEINPTD